MLLDLTHTQENFHRIPRVIGYKGSRRISHLPLCYFRDFMESVSDISAPVHLQLQLHEELFRLLKLS